MKFKVLCLTSILLISACASVDKQPSKPTTVTQTSSDQAKFIHNLAQIYRDRINLALGATGKVRNKNLAQEISDTLKAGAGELFQIQQWEKLWYPDTAFSDYLPAPIEMQGNTKKVESDFLRILINQYRSLINLVDNMPSDVRPDLREFAENIRAKQSENLIKLEDWKKVSE